MKSHQDKVNLLERKTRVKRELNLSFRETFFSKGG